MQEIPLTIGRTPHGPFSINIKPHTWVIGQTGVGKSTFQTNSFIQLIQDGYGGCFLDPHGSAIEKILRYIPRNRLNDVILIDPLADAVPSIIPQYHDKGQEQLYIQAMVSMFKSLFRDRWGDETERIITAAFDAISEYYGFMNIPAVYLFIARESFRKSILSKCVNPLLDDFKEQYDEKLKDNEQMSKFSPPLNKVDGFVRPIVRTLLSSQKPIDWARAMDEGRIILVNVPTGKLGLEISSLIGSIIGANIVIEAMRRGLDGKQFFFFMDEARYFLHAINFDIALSELRKFNVTLVPASQYLSQFPDLDAVFGNMQNGIAYRVGGGDAELIEKNYREQEQGMAKKIVELHDYQFIAHYKRGGIPLTSLIIDARAKVKKLGNEPPANAVIRESLRRWGSPRADLEADMVKLLASATA